MIADIYFIKSRLCWILIEIVFEFRRKKKKEDDECIFYFLKINDYITNLIDRYVLALRKFVRALMFL